MAEQQKVTGCYRCGHQNPEGQSVSRVERDAAGNAAQTFYCDTCWQTINGAAPVWIDGKPYYPDQLAFIVRRGRAREVHVPDCEWGGYAVERPLPGTALCWHAQLDFETLPGDEREMRRLIHAKLQVVGDAILKAWKERKNG
jgi:hypothetical protein